MTPAPRPAPGRASGRRRRKPVSTPTVLQMDISECGAAALAMVLAYWGHWASLEELRVACGVSRNGSKAANMLRAARGYGLEAQAAKLGPAALAHLEPPLVLHWDFSHFVVFEGLLRHGRARINDPASGRRTVSAAELDQSMTGVVLAFTPGPAFVRRGQRPRPLQALRERIAEVRGALAYVFFVSLLLVLPSLVTAAAARLFVDHVVLAREVAWVAPLLAVMAGSLGAMGLLGSLQLDFLLRFESHLAVRSSRSFFSHLLQLPMEFYNQRYTGDVSGRVALNDRLAELVARDLALNVLNLALLLFFACVMVQYDLWLTAIGVALASVNVLVLHWVSRRRADGNQRLLCEEGQLNSTALWGLEMIESLKASSSEGDLFARWVGQQAKVVNLRTQLDLANQPLERLAPLLTAVNATLVLGLGGLRVIDGELSLGGLLAFQILSAGFMGPVNRLVSLGRRLQLAEGEIRLLDDVLRAEPVIRHEVTGAPTESCVELTGRLELRGVSFGYGPLDPVVLQDVDLVVEPGTWVAVVGRTGSGKSSLAKLVAGLYEPTSGTILFDGRRREQLPRRLSTRSLAVVDQDVFVFEGTLAEQIRLWDDALPLERLRAAVRDACIEEEIEQRGGLDAWVAEGGANWSGGQLQRLELARALATDPKLLVLDEATSALDSDTEALIVRNLRRRGCACLVIAHRLSTVRQADEILVLDAGRVVERGRHEELVGRRGAYAQLVDE